MLDMCNRRLYDNVINIGEDLNPNIYAFTNYQILGVSLDCDKEELEKNYKLLKQLITDHEDCFTKKEIEVVEEAYRKFTSILTAVWYEHELGSAGVQNTNLLYKNAREFKESFDRILDKRGELVTVTYFEKDGNEFIHKEKENCILKSVAPYDSINVICKNDGVQEQCNLEFLGKTSAILSIVDFNKKTIYYNQYLNGDYKMTTCYNEETLNAYRVICYGLFKAKILDVAENAEVREVKDYKRYLKKI